MSVAAAPEPELPKEYAIKAAFLYNFTKFIEWPPGRFAGEGDPIVIAILGRNPFGDELGRIVSGRRVNGRGIVVRNAATFREAAAAHLIFVPEGEEGLLPPDPSWRDEALAVVGETEECARLGATITFVRSSDKVHFIVFANSADRAGLKISAQLLKLAAEVRRKS